jgi:hypothetical protein
MSIPVHQQIDILGEKAAPPLLSRKNVGQDSGAADDLERDPGFTKDVQDSFQIFTEGVHAGFEQDISMPLGQRVRDKLRERFH